MLLNDFESPGSANRGLSRPETVHRGRPVCVIGGGFAGISAAYELSTKGLPVVLLEKDEELGGLAGSFRVGGQMLEKFYHHWFTTDRYITDLVKRLGVEDQVDIRETRTGMYYAQNFFKLSSPLDLLRFSALPMRARFRLGRSVIAARRVRDWEKLEGTTAEEWLIQLCGREAYRVVWEPLLIGKFGDLAPEISAVWFWNKLKLRGGSRGRFGREKLAYFRGGFSALARAAAIAASSNGADIRTLCGVVRLEVRDHRLVAVHTSQGRLEVSAAILTTPLPIAADLLEPHVPTGYSAEIRRIRHLSNVCLVLALDRSLSTTYWLNVNDPSFPFVGIIEHTNFQPAATYGGSHLIYLSKYLPRDSDIYRAADADLYGLAIVTLKRMFPAFSNDWVRGFHVWRADYSQPVIERNYSSLIPDIQTPIENALLATMAQVYPEDRGTNYAVRSGLDSAQRIARILQTQSV